MTNNRVRIVIPARLASTRLPRKLLRNDTGKPLIQHTFESACKSRYGDSIVIAVDHTETASVVQSFGGVAVMTDPELPSGTDRVATVARMYPDYDLFVNVQGDEPEIDAGSIDRVIQTLQEDSTAKVATLATPIRSLSALSDPNVVKVVCDSHARALYFSRSPVPFAREGYEGLLGAEPPILLHHLGIYAYRREFLQELASLAIGRLESIEKLEQLRWLESGVSIAVGITPYAPKGIDTEADYQAFVQRIRESC